jgi:ABC-type Fe3+ transport system permease subunit
VAAVVYPAGFVLAEVVRAVAAGESAPAGRGVDGALFVRTLGVAGFIAVIATGLAAPAAWVARSMSWRKLIFLLAPLLLPSYLAYSGWGLLRAPGTVIGDWLMSRPGEAANWYPVLAGRVLAVGGLTLWLWPLPFLLLAMRIRRLDPAAVEALQLTGASWARRWIAVIGMVRGTLAAAVGISLLLMLGSAVPLHVAQFDTYAITIWRALDETAHRQHWAVWWRAWPLLGVALAAAVWIAAWATRPAAGESERPHEPGRGRWVGFAWAGGLWLLSVGAPVVLFATSLRSWRSVETFWRVTGGAVWNSAAVAVAAGAVCGSLAAACWYLASGPISRGRRGVVVPLVVGVLLLSGLAPGVLVGSMIARAYNAWAGVAWIGDSAAVLVLGHIARFGFVAALAGVLLARTEPAALRDARVLESGDSVRGWLRAALPPQLGAVAGVGIVCGLLSFQEIEATVLLQPPTAAGGSFAQRMLQHLHFARMEDLSAGVLVVSGAGLVICAVVVAIWPRRVP